MWRPAHAGWLARDSVQTQSSLIDAVLVGQEKKVEARISPRMGHHARI